MNRQKFSVVCAVQDTSHKKNVDHKVIETEAKA